MEKYAQITRKFLQVYLAKKAKELQGINQFVDDTFAKLLSFTTSGKLIRGSLVLFSYQSCGGENLTNVLPLAGAIELIHSGLLMHDDIMDQDTLRRGKPTIHIQYQTEAAKRNIADPNHYGISQAINLADLCFFLAFDLISRARVDGPIKEKLIQLYSSELTKTIFGQLNDIDLGMSTRIPREAEVLAVYRYKTARYTFSLPLLIGATAGQADSKLRQSLEKIGEIAGLLFQIRDDYLGIFGDSKKTGKSVAGDLRQGKKTLYYLALDRIGHKDLNKYNLAQVQSILKQSRLDLEFEQRMIALENQAIKLIGDLKITKANKLTLEKLIRFCRNRNS